MSLEVSSIYSLHCGCFLSPSLFTALFTKNIAAMATTLIGRASLLIISSFPLLGANKTRPSNSLFVLMKPCKQPMNISLCSVKLFQAFSLHLHISSSICTFLPFLSPQISSPSTSISRLFHAHLQEHSVLPCTTCAEIAMIITGVIRPRVAVHDRDLVHCMDKSLTFSTGSNDDLSLPKGMRRNYRISSAQ